MSVVPSSTQGPLPMCAQQCNPSPLGLLTIFIFSVCSVFLHSHADNNQQLCVIQYYFVIVGFSGDPRRDLPGLYLYMMKLLFHPHNSVGFMRVFAFSHKLCPRSRVIDCMADDVDYITVFVVPN